jgi:ABC-2 type transport system permease protein
VQLNGRREGSPFTGVGPVFVKELSDHLSSSRMMVLTLFVIVFGALPVGFTLQTLREVTQSDQYLFLRIFTAAPQSTASSTGVRSPACCRSRSIATPC